jgi:hydroxyacylglutathione hydrolase
MKIHAYARGPFATNTYLLFSEDETEAFVIDPTLETDDLAEELAGGGVRVHAVVNTHCHLDHSYGNAVFCEALSAPLWAHREDLPLLQNMETQATMFGIPRRTSPEPDRFLEEGETLALDGQEIRILHTPGHSPGSISLILEGVAIVGDVLFAGSIGRTDLWMGDFPTLRKSIHEKLFPLPDETRVLSGHGPETTIGTEKQSNPFVGLNAGFEEGDLQP